MSTFFTACREPRRIPDRWACGERAVKWLGAQRAGVFGEPVGPHQRDGAEPADVAIVEVAPVVERESAAWSRAPRASGSGPRLSSSAPVKRGCTTMRSLGVEVEHDQLGASPASHDARAAEPSRSGRRRRPRAARRASSTTTSVMRRPVTSRSRSRAMVSVSGSSGTRPAATVARSRASRCRSDTAYPANRTRCANSRLRCLRQLHVRRDGADGEHAPARGDERPSASRAVPAWKTKTPSLAGGRVITSPVTRRLGIVAPPRGRS